MRYILFILSALSLTSCMTTKKATDYLKSKGELAQVCADEYPVRDSVIVKDSVTLDTVYVGDVILDTVWMAISGDSSATDPNTYIGTTKGSNTNTFAIPIVTKTLPAKVITKTQVQVKEVYRENTARVAALQTDLQTVTGKLAKAEEKAKQLADEAGKWKKKARKRSLWIIGLVVFAFRRQIRQAIGGAGRILKHWAG